MKVDKIKQVISSIWGSPVGETHVSLTSKQLYSILKIIKGDYELLDVRQLENGSIVIEYDTGDET